MAPKVRPNPDADFIGTAQDTLLQLAKRRREQTETIYSGAARRLTPDAFAAEVERAGGVQYFAGLNPLGFHELPAYTRDLWVELKRRIALGEFTPNGYPNTVYFAEAVRMTLPFLRGTAPITTLPVSADVPVSPPPSGFVQITPEEAAAAEVKRKQDVQRYLYWVEQVQAASNPKLVDFAFQQGLFKNGKLRRSDEPGLTDFQGTLLAEINARILRGELTPNGQLIEQLASENGLGLGDVADVARRYYIERCGGR